MADILFGQSYFLRFDAKLWEAMQPLPPLGTLYAAAKLRAFGFSVAVFDAMLAESEADWAAALDKHRPRIAVLFEDNFNYLSKMCLLRMRQAAFLMIETACRFGCTVIAAGADASDHSREYLDAGADYVVRGEGEETLAELIETLSHDSHADVSEVRGLVWRRDGHEIVNPPRPDIKDLDGLPFPAWDLADVERYRQIWIEHHGYFALNMATTRGCPFHCNWCAKPIWGQRYQVRSPKNVAAETTYLMETYWPEYIWFVDDIFGLKAGWVARFGSALKAAGVSISYKCLSRADLLLRPGEVEALADSGAKIVWIGAESGSQRILDAMEKGIRVEQIYAASKALHTADIEVGFFLQFGYPGESRSDIEQTLRMVRDCSPDDIGISVSYPLPGTRFYESVRSQLGDRRNWIDSEDLAMLYRGPFTTDFYRQLHRVTHMDFRRGRNRRIWLHGRSNPHEAPVGTAERAGALFKSLVYSTRLPFERRRLDRLSIQPHHPSQVQISALTSETAAIPSDRDES